MEFWVVLVQSFIKMIVVAGVILGGIRVGKVLRDRRDAGEPSGVKAKGGSSGNND